ncbi:MAG: class IIb bacteriocin, lactobin A/cerein 7B family [Mollicutes bacterium]|jgi:lactobin A/cerein 7B family class IIb bacteriocin|nr:class IIb bacteriocin, lactobin A/cerein 7B family [Mollicutes bacterium]
MLTDTELLNIKGGAVSWGLVALVGGLLTILAGIVDGYLRPLSCNK